MGVTMVNVLKTLRGGIGLLTTGVAVGNGLKHQPGWNLIDDYGGYCG